MNLDMVIGCFENIPTIYWWVGLGVFVVQFTFSWWFLCNLGNKHSNKTYWYPYGGNEVGFVFWFSVLMGFILIPFLFFIMCINRK